MSICKRSGVNYKRHKYASDFKAGGVCKRCSHVRPVKRSKQSRDVGV